MRIMQVCTNFLPGGIQRHVLDLTEDLRRFGHTVVLAGDSGDWSKDKSDPDFVPLALKSVAGTGGSAVRRIAAIYPVVRKLRQAIRQHKIQLVHAHETAPALIAKMATIGLGIPVIMTFHGSAPEREASVARIGRFCSNLTISPSHASIEALVSKGLPKSKARVLGLGIKQQPPVPKSHATALRKSLLGGRDGVLILSLSRLAHQKGIDLMVEVARQVTAKRPDVVFAVAGGGPLAKDVEVWARDAGVAENMRFLGPISTVPQHLAAADIFLLTSRWEALPISIVEAYRAGLPVIATDCGGVKELVNDRFGALLQVGDVVGIVEAVLQLVEDPKLRRSKGLAARKHSQEDRFSPEAVHRQFENLYADIIG